VVSTATHCKTNQPTMEVINKIIIEPGLKSKLPSEVLLCVDVGEPGVDILETWTGASVDVTTADVGEMEMVAWPFSTWKYIPCWFVRQMDKCWAR